MPEAWIKITIILPMLFGQITHDKSGSLQAPESQAKLPTGGACGINELCFFPSPCHSYQRRRFFIMAAIEKVPNQNISGYRQKAHCSVLFPGNHVYQSSMFGESMKPRQ